MADQTSRRYLFVAIDRATRWVFIRIYNSKTAANARRFLRDLERACPLHIRTILTPSRRMCHSPAIHLPVSRTNGMIERFPSHAFSMHCRAVNGRIEDLLQSHHFRSGEALETTLHRYVWRYNQQLPQSALGTKTPFAGDEKLAHFCSGQNRPNGALLIRRIGAVSLRR